MGAGTSIRSRRQFDRMVGITDQENYLERAQCIINQYGNYSFPELGLNVIIFKTTTTGNDSFEIYKSFFI